VQNAFIIPHFDEIPFVARFAMTGLLKNLDLIGIEGNTSLLCTNQNCTVEGTGGVTIQTGGQKVRYLSTTKN